MKRFIAVAFIVLIIGACGHKAPPPGKPDIEPPTLTVLYPVNGETLTVDTVRIKLKIEDKSPIKLLRIVIDGKVYKSTGDIDSLFFTTDSLVDSLPHRFIIKASDVWDNWGTSPPVNFYLKKR